MSNPLELRRAAMEAIDSVLSQIQELESLVSDFNGDNAALHTKLSEYVSSLKALHSAGTVLKNRDDSHYEIPVELLKYLDDGGNPDTFIIDAIRSGAAANEAAKGKVDAFRELQSGLMKDLETALPETMAAYKALRPPEKSGGEGGGGAAT